MVGIILILFYLFAVALALAIYTILKLINLKNEIEKRNKALEKSNKSCEETIEIIRDMNKDLLEFKMSVRSIVQNLESTNGEKISKLKAILTNANSQNCN